MKLFLRTLSEIIRKRKEKILGFKLLKLRISKKTLWLKFCLKFEKKNQWMVVAYAGGNVARYNIYLELNKNITSKDLTNICFILKRPCKNTNLFPFSSKARKSFPTTIFFLFEKHDFFYASHPLHSRFHFTSTSSSPRSLSPFHWLCSFLFSFLAPSRDRPPSGAAIGAPSLSLTVSSPRRFVPSSWSR